MPLSGTFLCRLTGYVGTLCAEILASVVGYRSCPAVNPNLGLIIPAKVWCNRKTSKFRMVLPACSQSSSDDYLLSLILKLRRNNILIHLHCKIIKVDNGFKKICCPQIYSHKYERRLLYFLSNNAQLLYRLVPKKFSEAMAA